MALATQGAARNANAKNDNEDKKAAVPPTSFIRATDENVAPGNIDFTRTVTASSQDLGITDLPAYGWLGYLELLVTATGGAAGLATVAAAEDAPFNVLQDIALTEPNGAYHVQFPSGWQLYLSNKLGGYLPPYAADPRSTPVFSDIDTDGDFTFVLYIPVCLSRRDGLGAQANQDSAGQFKFRATVAASSTLYTTAPDTLPSVRIRGYLHSFDQPAANSMGRPQSTMPPANGLTSYWTVQSGITVSSGENTIELKRRGNYLRQIIFVLRTSGSRNTAESNWPDETRFLRDAFPARYYQNELWRHLMFSRTGYSAANEAAGGLDDGVRFHDYCSEFDGGLGRETRVKWQPTLGSTRLEIAGQFGAASTLDVITNDIAIPEHVVV